MTDARIAAPPTPDLRRRALADAPVTARQFTPFRGRYLEAPVVEASIADLVYRAANGRIVAELGQAARREGRDAADLTAAQDTAEVQTLLHGLLAEKAADPTGPVLQELARHGQQTEPLLLTADGVVVNGNRRLAAMRELQARDPDRYAGFATVRAAVLPDDATDADLEFIEASLQMAPDVKLAYGWINRRMKLAHQHRTLGLAAEAIADAYRMETPGQVEVELGELALADAYLDWRGLPGDYAAIGDLEPLFVGLTAATTGLTPAVRDFWRHAGFMMIAARACLPGPIDRMFPFVPPAPQSLPTWALRRFAEERGLVTPVDGVPAGPRAPELPGDALASVDALVASPERSDEVAGSLYGLLEQLRSEHADNRAPAVALKQLTRARAALAGVEIGRLSPKQLRELRSEMAALQASVATLLGDGPAAPAPDRRGGVLGALLGRG